MLSVGKLRPGGEGYYLEAVARGAEDYYLAPAEAAGRWVGVAAGAIGLVGEVEADALRAVLAGRDPTTGERLAETRAPGVDLTISAPKSVSLLYALGDEVVSAVALAAHERAVAAALGYLEREAAWARRGHAGAQRVPAMGLVASAFLHETSRAGDPQLHTHVLVANLALTPDGRTSGLDLRALYRHARTAGYLYQAELRRRLSRDLGVGWGAVRTGQAEIAGFDPRTLRAFSRRRSEIEAQLRKHQLDGPSAARVAALHTRQAKDYGVDAERLASDWHRRADGVGLDVAEVLRAGRDVGHHRTRRPDRDPDRDLEVVGPDHLTGQNATFTRQEVIRALCERAGTSASADEVVLRADVVLADVRGVVALPTRSAAQEPRFTTREMLGVERALILRAVERRGEGAGIVEHGVLHRMLDAASGLSEEQRRMVERLVSSGDGVEVVRGRAGSGKTFALGVAHRAWQEGGQRVIGVALAARAAAGLEAGAGIPSDTIARLLGGLERGAARLDHRTVLIVDEAAMVGTRDLARLAAHCDDVGTKLVLVGDDAQLPEIAAGGAFRALATRLGATELLANRRQEQAWEQQALVALRDGDAEKALAAYAEHGRIRIAADEVQAMRDLVADWWRAHWRGEDAVMLAARRADVTELNRLAGERARRAGEVREPELVVAGQRIGVGERVVTTRNDRLLGVRNGERAVVTAVDPDEQRVTAMAGSRAVCLPRPYLEAGGLEPGYALTAHKAQGLTCDRAFVLGTAGLSREWGYTALSRARWESRLYIVHDPMRAVAHDLERSRAKGVAIDGPGLDVGL